jgi:hypothetical protein
MCWDPYREGQVSTLDQVQKRAAKFAKHLVPFSCKLNTFKKRVKNVVTSKGIQVRIDCK